MVDVCPWCEIEILEKGKGLMPLTIHLTKHTRTELAMLVVDMLVNPEQYKRKVRIG
jgi:hypothetical protein